MPRAPINCYTMQWELEVYGSVQISVTKVCDPMILALRGSGGGGAKIPGEKNYVTLECMQWSNQARRNTQNNIQQIILQQPKWSETIFTNGHVSGGDLVALTSMAQWQ